MSRDSSEFHFISCIAHPNATINADRPTNACNVDSSPSANRGYSQKLRSCPKSCKMNLPLFTKAKIIKNAKFHPSIFDLKKFFLIFFFCISSRSRWVLSAPEEKIQKFVDSAKKKIHQNSLKFIEIRVIFIRFL